MTRAAGAGSHGLGDLRRVWIVATHATSRLFRMVGMDILVTGRTGARWRRSHVVRRMAARAGAVGGDASAADHIELRVAAAAGCSFFFRELVRLVTADTLRVPARKKS